jgi:hypothetical protein
MDEQAPTAVGGPKVMAFRIIAGLFGVITVLAMIGSAIPVLTNDQDKVHSFHVLGVIPVYVLLAGLPLIVLALHPTDVVALRVAWAVFIGPLDLVILTFLAPTRGELVRFGSPVIALLSLAILGAIPAVVYAWRNARIQLEVDPMTDMTGHWSNHHWSGIAGAALALVLVGAVLAFRRPGDRMWIWMGGLAAMLFGAAAVIFSDDARYPSSLGTLWGLLVLFAGLVYIVVAEVMDRAPVEAAA